jgi:galactose oxidase-like protein/Kelch motif protein
MIHILQFVALFALWLSGPVAMAQTGGGDDPSQVGEWSSLVQLPHKAVHVHVLPDARRLLIWPSFGFGDNPFFWDITTGVSTPATQAGWNIFCAGHAFLPDGRLFVAGGHSNSCPFGLANAAIYDPIADSWTQLPNMNSGRWYPSAITLSNGDMLVLAGTIDPTIGPNTLPQVWQGATGTWRNLTTAQTVLQLYPRVFVAASGKVVMAGPNPPTRYLDTTGTGKWSAPISKMQFGTRSYAPAVMYDVDKLFTVGGGDPPTATAEIIDLGAAPPAWQYTESMSVPRRQHNATLLPDGKVLVTGGSSGAGFDNAKNPVYKTEMWDPATGKWTIMASISVFRGYHGTAVLLPDGTVFSSGGEKSANTAEIFSPPYLFRGPRPTIVAAPQTATYGQVVQVVTPDAPHISKVTLLRLGSATHAFNMNQRINFLSFQGGNGILQVTIPASGTLAPPGHYFLFIVNSEGVPSVAKVIAIS